MLVLPIHKYVYTFAPINAGFRLFGGGGGIKHELKKLMFSGDTPVPVCEGNGAKFCMVMSVFHNYERQVSCISQ